MNRTEPILYSVEGLVTNFNSLSVCVQSSLEFQMNMDAFCMLAAASTSWQKLRVSTCKPRPGRRKAVFLKACHSLRLMHVASWAISILTIHFNSRKMGMGMESIYAHVVRYAYMYHHVPSCTLKHSSKIPFVELFKC